MAASRQWVCEFVKWYNNEHHHSGINFLTPSQRHSEDFGLEVLANRKAVYEEARLKNPCRWSMDTRNWRIADKVYLNPEKTEKAVTIEEDKVS